MTAGAGESFAQGCICLRQLRTLGLLERAFDFLKHRTPSERNLGGPRVQISGKPATREVSPPRRSQAVQGTRAGIFNSPTGCSNKISRRFAITHWSTFWSARGTTPKRERLIPR